jgi:hypothetical protein
MSALAGGFTRVLVAGCLIAIGAIDEMYNRDSIRLSSIKDL